MQDSPFCNANSQDICLLYSFLEMPFDVEGEVARGDVLRETAVHGEEGEGEGAQQVAFRGLAEACRGRHRVARHEGHAVVCIVHAAA